MNIRSWIVFGVLAAVSVVYIIASAKAYSVVKKLDDKTWNASNEVVSQLKKNFRGGKAAAVLSALCVLAYGLLFFAFNMGSWFRESTIRDILFGVLSTASLYSSAFMILAGIVLQVNELTVDKNLEDGDLRSYRFAFVLAYIMVGIYFSLFIYHLWNKHAEKRSTLHSQA